MSFSENPRAVAGGNLSNDAPDFAKMEVERLTDDYGQLGVTVSGLLDEAAAIPERIEDDETKGRVASLIKRMRDATKRIEGFHDLEKQPSLRRGQGVDQYFFGLWDKIAKRAKANRDGAADVLQRRLTDYDVRKLAEEQERRRKIAEETARVERLAIAEREKAEREAREKTEAAERARVPAKIEEKTFDAAKAAAMAAAARVEETVAAAAAEEAHVATLARPADIMRQRGDDGTLSTMGTEKFAELFDRSIVDLEKLRPHFAFADLEKALRGYAASVNYSGDASVQIAGARFGKKPRSSVR
jgi:hypothetical protein